MSTIVLASAYATGVAGMAGQAHLGHDIHTRPVSPDQLGGAYEYLDL